MDLTLEEKENLALECIRKELKEAKIPVVLFDGRIESLVVLHLLRRTGGGKIQISVLHIDTSQEFKEIYQYIEKMKTLWRFSLIREMNENAIRIIKFADEKDKCCSVLKTEVLKTAIQKNNIDLLFASDYGIAKTVELSKTQSKQKIICPIKHFSTDDIWNYIKKYNLPYCSLYDKGYQNILCIQCTEPAKPKENQLAIKEETEIKNRLKALGYM